MPRSDACLQTETWFRTHIYWEIAYDRNLLDKSLSLLYIVSFRFGLSDSAVDPWVYIHSRHLAQRWRRDHAEGLEGDPPSGGGGGGYELGICAV